MIYGTIMWLLVAIIFVPKIKDILISKNEKFKTYIIPIRIVLTILALCAFATLTNQFEGKWITEDGKELSINSEKINFIDDENEKQEKDYTYKSITDSDFDYVYEIKVTNEIVYRYYKKTSEEYLCKYMDNKCIDYYNKVND